MKLNSFIITRNAQVPLKPCRSPWLLMRTQFSLFKKLLAAITCGFQTKDRSKSLEVTNTATSVQEKHGRAQVSACVIITFINGCRNEVHLILSRASKFACHFEMLACLTACLWEERCVTTQSMVVLQTNRVRQNAS